MSGSELRHCGKGVSPVPPHPSPLPKGEGELSAALRQIEAPTLSVVPYGNGRAGNIRKAWAEILAALDWLHCTLRAFRYSKAPQPSPPREERGKQRASFGRWLCELERRINPAFRWWCQDAPMCAGGVQFNCRTSSPDLINTPLQRGVVRVRWLETVSTVSWLAWSERAIE